MNKYSKEELEQLLVDINLKLRDLELQKAFIKHYIKKLNK
tara:strand:- start:345 stop:464 length:120 start_codon:yes stop_codon:yes gene_type:complete